MYNKALRSPREVDDLLRTLGDASREQTRQELRGLSALRGGAQKGPVRGFFSDIFGNATNPLDTASEQPVYPWDMHYLRDIK